MLNPAILVLGLFTAVFKWILKGGKVSFTELLFGKKNGSMQNYNPEVTYINAIWGIIIIVIIVVISIKFPF